MTQPLALVLHEKILPGRQIVNRLQDLNYRVETLAQAAQLVERAQELKPLLVVADLQSSRGDVCQALGQLRQNPPTHHLPVLAFGGDGNPALEEQARQAGATLVAGEPAMRSYLEQLLERVLQID